VVDGVVQRGRLQHGIEVDGFETGRDGQHAADDEVDAVDAAGLVFDARLYLPQARARSSLLLRHMPAKSTRP
jgi:hypothetical protein